VIGASNIAYLVCVALVAAFFAGVGLTIFGSISLGRLSRVSIPTDSVSAESAESSVGQSQEEKEE
jgi:hypothetical protein